ncbi:hypothetical protein CAPTEDRAFT_222323 [Capitella teleta]|uniref:Protein phosphatase 1 regulatory subunit 21 n=1 Tax=Capitella teleta TaxID=283909 RepID=R7U0R3_CAPTE|nr:hypothetical protein CAPTEDRAFT_222323 [Capitella teleta]|eukprot:ELT99452.1 hypothetical protein CAPTEDRAFT_222323 [Capitella teleta]
MTDIQAKYQKLAAEYAKLRAQVPILKKAVVDEQNSNEELKESLKSKELTVRKYEQEIDSLSFRNQQLASRVGVLQDDLNDAGKNKKHKKGTPDPPARESSVIGEELQSKIEENARLHKQVYEADAEYKERVNVLQDRLSQLESEASRHANVLKEAQLSSQRQIDKLTDDCVQLKLQLQKYQRDAKDAVSMAQSLEHELHTTQVELGSELVKAKSTILNKVAFDDTEDAALNSLNLPCYDRKHQMQTREVVHQVKTIVKDLVQFYSNYYTYCEQRVGNIQSDEDVNQKLGCHLHENLSVLKPIEYAFNNFCDSVHEDALTTLETAKGIRDFAGAFHQLAIYSSKLLPYQLLSLEAESAMSACTASLEAKNSDLSQSLRQADAALNKVDSYLQLLAAPSDIDSQIPRSSHNAILSNMSDALSSFHDSLKELSKQFNAKVSLEHQLPTASHKLKVTDECIVAALINLTGTARKLTTFFSGNLEFFCCPVACSSLGCRVLPSGPIIHPAVEGFRQQSAEYMSLINSPCSESVPYQCAIQNRKTIYSSTESRESLAQQVTNLQEKLSQAEQDKEHWRLESQLLQMRLEKETQKANDLMKKFEGGDGCHSVSVTNNQVPGGPPDASILGEIERSGDIADDADGRESLIREHYTQRIADITTKLQMADSKAVHFHAECRALHRRLRLLEQEQQTGRGEASQSMQTIAQLKDELQTTTKSYEGQLSMMSEHLANMNEKLTTQKDEIDALKYQAQNSAKPTKRGIGKLVR